MSNVTSTELATRGWLSRYPRTAGALLLLALHAVLAPFAGTYLGVKPEAGLYLIGVTQLAYVVPLFILLMKLGRSAIAKGMAFAALATFVVNAAGCGVLLWQLSKIDG
jgi:hypothetical protein